MTGKQHICSRMVDYIESQGQTVSKWEEKASEFGVKVSVGYLRKAAKKGYSIGFDLIEYFLRVFPGVDLTWLVTGEKNEISSDDLKDYKPIIDQAVKQSWVDTITDLNVKVRDLEYKLRETKKNASISTAQH